MVTWAFCVAVTGQRCGRIENVRDHRYRGPQEIKTSEKILIQAHFSMGLENPPQGRERRKAVRLSSNSNSLKVKREVRPAADESWLSQQPRDTGPVDKLYLRDNVAAQEKAIIEAALRESQGRVSRPSGAAAKLGIARSTLDSKTRSLKINKHLFRP